MTLPSWVVPRAWLSFIELDKAVVLVWLDWLVFYEYGFSVSALWCPLATPTILLGFLSPWARGLSSQLLQQSTAIAPYLGRRVSPHHCPSWPSTWESSSMPPCAREDSTHGHHQMVNIKIRLIIFFAAKDREALYSQRWRSSIQSTKTRPRADCGWYHELLLPNSNLNWRK